VNHARVIALGFFDGVHLGHGALLRRAGTCARTLGCKATALTFDVHPLQVLAGKQVPLLTTTRERIRLMEELYAMDEVMVLPFDGVMAAMDWEDFVEQILLKRYGACHVVCGYDYTFGHKGLGTADKLRQKCAAMGVGCDIIDRTELDGVTLSSTYIRSLLEAGNVTEANRFLGHPYAITGEVIPGKQLGHTLGIPTANVAVPEGLLPPANGVYATRVYLPDGTVKTAVTNVGLRPTVKDDLGLVMEPWILDFGGDLYGRTIRVEFHARLRPERRFESLDALKAEILRNAHETRALLDNE
jgi:riboflavin kinase/FMN adenylyltransferase